MIADDPNAVIASSIDLDESSVLSLLGDVPGALEMAQRAARSATVSGWAKGRRVAALNIAKFLVSLGRLSEVDEQIRIAKEQSFHSVTFEVGLADTQAQVAYCRGLDEAAEDVLTTVEQLSEGVPQWHRLTNHITRNRLLIRLNRFGEAVESATECLQAAERLGSERLAATFRIQRAEALLGLGQPGESGLFAASFSTSLDLPLSIAGSLHLVAAKALFADGLVDRGQQRLGTAIRILDQAGDKPAEMEARSTGLADGARGSQSSTK